MTANASDDIDRRSAAYRLVSGFGEAPWQVHGAITLGLAAAMLPAIMQQLLPRQAAAWTILLALFGLALSASGGAKRLRINEAIPTDPVVLFIGYVGVLLAGAGPFLWWAWSGRSSSNTVAFLAAAASSVGLLLATRSGLLVALVGSLLLVGVASGSGANRLVLAIALMAILCAAACFGSMAGPKASGPNASGPKATGPKTPESLLSQTSAFTKLPRLAIAAVALASIFLGLLVEGPLTTGLDRLSSTQSAAQRRSTGGGAGLRNGEPQNPLFRKGSKAADGTLQYADSFNIDQFGALSTAEVIRVSYFMRPLGYGSLFPTLLRGQAFDTWDGRGWSANTTKVTRSSGNVLFDRTEAGDFEPLISGAQVNLLGGSSDLVFGEGRIASVDVATNDVFVSLDETIRTTSPMGKGSRYVVFSSRHPWRDGGPPTPLSSLNEGIALFEPYGVRPEHLDTTALSQRTRSLALQLGNDAPSIEGVERNIERWLAANTGYDFTARQKPATGDVVDDFLFESKRGWCEQIATATVMMLRANGIPARLATGYKPSVTERDGSLMALSRDAHAWVEMYLPGRGWAPRDPTSIVPVVNAPPIVKPQQSSLSGKTLLVAAALMFVLGLSMFALRRVAQRLVQFILVKLGWARPEPDWWEAHVATLEQLGERRGVARDATQTLSEFGASLHTATFTDDRVNTLVSVLERERFGDELLQASDTERAWVEATLSDLDRAYPVTTSSARKNKR